MRHFVNALRRSIWILPTIVLLILTCCTQKEEIEKKTMQELKLNLTTNPTSLNPMFGFDLYCRSLQKATFEGLTRNSAMGIPEPALAEDIAISPSKTLYTFTLRESYFSNGERLTAYHFEDSWKRAIAPDSPCVRADLFYPIKNAKRAKKGEVSLDEVGVRAIDEEHLLVELEHPTPYFLDLLSCPLFFPFYDDSSEPTVFNGPFKVALWDHESKLVLERNPLYWAAKDVQLDRIVFSIVHDPQTALLMYEKGELDWIGGVFTMLPLDAVSALKEKLTRQPIGGIYWLSFNLESPPLSHPKVRKALAYALNRKEIAEEVLCGELPTRYITHPRLSMQKEDLYSDGDATTARALFEEALQELHLTRDTLPTLTFNHSDIPGQKKMAESIVHQWEKVLGIKVEIQGCEWAVYLANLLSQQYQIGGCIFYPLFSDPIYHLEFFKERLCRYNAPQWENREYQELLNLADAELDPALREEYLRKAEAILIDEMPIVPIFASSNCFMHRENLKGIVLSELGDADLKCAFFERPSLVAR